MGDPESYRSCLAIITIAHREKIQSIFTLNSFVMEHKMECLLRIRILVHVATIECDIFQSESKNSNS